mgnify:CR=1 FL=1|jgi:hypothetical protein
MSGKQVILPPQQESHTSNVNLHFIADEVAKMGDVRYVDLYGKSSRQTMDAVIDPYNLNVTSFLTLFGLGAIVAGVAAYLDSDFQNPADKKIAEIDARTNAMSSAVIQLKEFEANKAKNDDKMEKRYGSAFNLSYSYHLTDGHLQGMFGGNKSAVVSYLDSMQNVIDPIAGIPYGKVITINPYDGRMGLDKTVPGYGGIIGRLPGDPFGVFGELNAGGHI